MKFTKLLTLYSAAGAITLVAWVLNVAQLYWMAGVLLLLPTACRMMSRLELRGVTVSRAPTLAGHQGESVPMRLRLRNELKLPKLGLSLKDSLPPGLTAHPAEPIPVTLQGKSEETLEYRLQLRRRGAHHISGVRLLGTDLLGVAPAEGLAAATAEVLVYPRIIELPEMALPPSRGGGQTMQEAAFRKGEGSSFFGIREYRPGDPLRHVHWRTAARLGKLAVVEWEAEESTDVLIAIETRTGSERNLADGTTLDVAAGLAGSLASMILRDGDSVRLLAPGASEWHPGVERGVDSMPGMLTSLARMKSAAEESITSRLRLVAPHVSPGTLICILTPDPSTALVECVRYLQAARMRVAVYALETGHDVKSWDAAANEVRRLSSPVIRLNPDDAVVKTLLS